MNKILSNGLPADWQDHFTAMMALLDKSEKWWIVNFEIPTNPDFDDKVIGKSDIIPGPLVGMRMLLDIALGSEEESKLYWEEYKKRFPNT